MQDREQLVTAMRELGFMILPSAANFIFARHAKQSADDLAQSLRKRNIIVRHFKQSRIENFLRITIGTAQQCQELVKALKEILSGS